MIGCNDVGARGGEVFLIVHFQAKILLVQHFKNSVAAAEQPAVGCRTLGIGKRRTNSSLCLCFIGYRGLEADLLEKLSRGLQRGCHLIGNGDPKVILGK